MIKLEKMDVYGFEAALRGMRNPMNSWDRSDSNSERIGPKDMNLAKKLLKAGTEHRKFLRMIHMTMDITAPLYWWKEYDTYKVGTVANSCSTMHKIQAKEFVLSDFSTDHLSLTGIDVLREVIKYLNEARDIYDHTKSKDAWWDMIQLLPTSYNQKRTVDLNYEVALTILKQREGHKLDEWKVFREYILEEAPYMREIWDKKEVNVKAGTNERAFEL